MRKNPNPDSMLQDKSGAANTEQGDTSETTQQTGSQGRAENPNANSSSSTIIDEPMKQHKHR